MLSESYKNCSHPNIPYSLIQAVEKCIAFHHEGHARTHTFTRQFVSVKLPQDQQITQRFLSFRYSCASEVVLCGEQKHLLLLN